MASSDVYRYKEQSSLYTEPENVTVVDQTWTNPGGRLNYLYKVEPDGELTIPPLGMRSAVALGGEFRLILQPKLPLVRVPIFTGKNKRSFYLVREKSENLKVLPESYEILDQSGQESEKTCLFFKMNFTWRKTVLVISEYWEQ